MAPAEAKVIKAGHAAENDNIYIGIMRHCSSEVAVKSTVIVRRCVSQYIPIDMKASNLVSAPRSDFGSNFFGVERCIGHRMAVAIQIPHSAYRSRSASACGNVRIIDFNLAKGERH